MAPEERLPLGNLAATPVVVRRWQAAPAGCVSLAVHVVVGALLIVLPELFPGHPRLPVSPRPEQRVVWIPSSAWIPPEEPGGGGGEPRDVAPKIERPKAAEAPIETAPAVTPLPQEPEPEPEPALLSTDDATAALFSGPTSMPEALNGSVASQGGDGTLLGRSGNGPGEGGGFGGGAYRPGAGVSVPVSLRDTRPRYTPAAMLARVEGSVLLEAVVLADGTVGEIRIVRSFDPVSGQDYGLDQEAVNAVRQWQFSPGRRFGQPVAVLVKITVTFRLR